MKILLAFARATALVLAGLALATAVGLLVAITVPAAVGTFVSPAIAGLFVALAMRKPLDAPRAILPLGALGATLGFLVGSLAGFALHRLGATAISPYATAVGCGVGVAASHRVATRRAPIALAIPWTITVALLLVPGVPPLARAFALLVPGMVASLSAVRPRAGDGSSSGVRRSPDKAHARA